MVAAFKILQREGGHSRATRSYRPRNVCRSTCTIAADFELCGSISHARAPCAGRPLLSVEKLHREAVAGASHPGWRRQVVKSSTTASRGLANMGGVEEGHTASEAPPAGLSSGEVNFLVYRYLLESGFGHAAFAFGNESDVGRVDVRGKDVPVGALVSFIQKGFQLVELEANLNANGTDVYGKYVQFSANDILTKDLGELRKIAEEIQEGDKEKEEASPSKGGRKGKKNKRFKVEVSALEGANGVAVAEGALPPLEVEMDVDDVKEGVDDRGDVDGRAAATESPGSPALPRDLGDEEREALGVPDMKEEAVAGMKSEVGDVAEVEEAGEAVEAGEAGRPWSALGPSHPRSTVAATAAAFGR